MHEYLIFKAGSLFQTWHAFHNLHLLWVWQKRGIEKSFISAVVNFASFVETTLLSRSFTVAREAATDEASPQKSNLLPPTVMQTRYFLLSRVRCPRKGGHR